MVIKKHHLNGLVTLFFIALIVLVFQQIATSMTEQGIASGGPYDNAATYPRIVAILIGILLLLQFVLSWLARKNSPAVNQQAEEMPLDEGISASESEEIELASLARPAAMLVVFALYLSLLSGLGYHLTTPVMIAAIMFVAGMRQPILMIAAAIGLSLFFAFMFEFFLKIVLPGGVFHLNIPW